VSRRERDCLTHQKFGAPTRHENANVDGNAVSVTCPPDGLAAGDEVALP